MTQQNAPEKQHKMCRTQTITSKFGIQGAANQRGGGNHMAL